MEDDIYIPLCLYLYTYPKFFRLCLYRFTFHYASTYTNHFCLAPLCPVYLHSTMPLLIRSRSRSRGTEKLIYIPLCLYLYISTIQDGNIVTLFTFHYASTYTDIRYDNEGKYHIYIPLCLYLYIAPAGSTFIPLIFTFHYASTYTRDQLLYFRSDQNLHSTMPLLIPSRDKASILCSLIYIPLCLYLYYLASATDFE